MDTYLDGPNAEWVYAATQFGVAILSLLPILFLYLWVRSQGRHGHGTFGKQLRRFFEYKPKTYRRYEKRPSDRPIIVKKRSFFIEKDGGIKR